MEEVGHVAWPSFAKADDPALRAVVGEGWIPRFRGV
jgi:hypothetical protein